MRELRSENLTYLQVISTIAGDFGLASVSEDTLNLGVADELLGDLWMNAMRGNIRITPRSPATEIDSITYDVSGNEPLEEVGELLAVGGGLRGGVALERTRSATFRESLQ